MIEIVNWTRAKDYRIKMVMILNKTITNGVYLLYPLFILYLVINKNKDVYPILLVTAISFGLVSIFRSLYNAKRPYEIYDYEPLIKKKKLGQSFPSRHVFSIFAITMNVLYFNTLGGVVLLFFGIVLAVCRVLGGVHFPKDVIAGAIFGIVPFIYFF